MSGVYKGADSVKPATTRFVRAVLEHSPSIGVRGEQTRDYLNSLGFGDEHVKVIGCPSMFMYGPDLNVEKKVESLNVDSPIALNVSPYVPQMGPISLYAAEHFPNLVYMAQNIQTLELMLYGSYPKGKRMNAMAAQGAPITLDHPLIRSDRVRFFLDPKTWFDHLAQYDFSFGTRIHGNIAALLAGTPALPAGARLAYARARRVSRNPASHHHQHRGGCRCDHAVRRVRLESAEQGPS